MADSFSTAKAWFLLSLLVLSFGYGFASHAWGLFPKTYVERAWRQGYWLATDNSFEKRYSHPQTFKRDGARTLNPELNQPGPTSVTSWWETAEGLKVGMKLVDRRGRVLHEWSIDREETFETNLSERKDPLGTDIQGSLLLSGGDVVINLEYVGMVRMNSCGNVLWKLTEGNHHSIAQAEDGSFWVPGVGQKPRAGTERHPNLPGLGSIWIDRILNVSEAGEILRDIKVVDILYENGLEHFFFRYGKREGDVTHLNDVEPLSSSQDGEYPLFEDGDLLVSLRPMSLVFVFDPDTREVKWHTSGPFIKQHDPDFIGDGWIGVFDNNQDRGKVMGQGSRIVAIQPHTDSAEILFRPDHLDEFYTWHRGKWQMLENQNMLLTDSDAGRVAEVDSVGKPVWEWIHESYGSRTPSVTKATRHEDLTREEVASWPCSSVDSIRTSTANQ